MYTYTTEFHKQRVRCSIRCNNKQLIYFQGSEEKVQQTTCTRVLTLYKDVLWGLGYKKTSGIVGDRLTYIIISFCGGLKAPAEQCLCFKVVKRWESYWVK